MQKKCQVPVEGTRVSGTLYEDMTIADILSEDLTTLADTLYENLTTMTVNSSEDLTTVTDTLYAELTTVADTISEDLRVRVCTHLESNLQCIYQGERYFVPEL